MVLSRDSTVPRKVCAYLVDPDNGHNQKCEPFKHSLAVNQIALHAISVEHGQKAMTSLMSKIYDRHVHERTESLVSDAFDGMGVAEGEPLTDEVIRKLARQVAEAIVRSHLRIDSRESLTIEGLIDDPLDDQR
jgi:hypothetical protein